MQRRIHRTTVRKRPVQPAPHARPRRLSIHTARRCRPARPPYARSVHVWAALQPTIICERDPRLARVARFNKSAAARIEKQQACRLRGGDIWEEWRDGALQLPPRQAVELASLGPRCAVRGGAYATLCSCLREHVKLLFCIVLFVAVLHCAVLHTCEWHRTRNSHPQLAHELAGHRSQGPLVGCWSNARAQVLACVPLHLCCFVAGPEVPPGTAARRVASAAPRAALQHARAAAARTRRSRCIACQQPRAVEQRSVCYAAWPPLLARRGAVTS